MVSELELLHFSLEFLLQLRDLSGQSNDLSMLLDLGFPTA